MATFSSHFLNSINGTHANGVKVIIYQINANGDNNVTVTATDSAGNSTTKIQLLCDQYFNHDVERNKKMSKREKLQLDSEIDISKSFDKINEILNSNVYCNYEIWCMNNIDIIKSKINRNINDSKDLFGEDITDIQKTLSYEKNKDLKYSLDFDDSVTQNISRICHLSTIYKLL